MPTGAIEVSRIRSALADRYRIERVLGEGGMATVYLAEDLKHRRKVAVKVMRPELAATLGSDRFLREVEIAAKLSHPNILPVYDSGEANGILYYVMPLVEGETLPERLTREKQLPVHEALRIAREVAEALGYAHARGIVHRDIKPANILMNAGHAMVADFGIARAAESSEQALTQTGLAVGTPQYMSPEQASGEQRRRSHRHLRAWLRAVRDAGGRAAVHGAHRAGDHRAQHHRDAAPAAADAHDAGAGDQHGGVHRDRQGAGRPLRHRNRDGRGTHQRRGPGPVRQRRNRGDADQRAPLVAVGRGRGGRAGAGSRRRAIPGRHPWRRRGGEECRGPAVRQSGTGERGVFRRRHRR